MKYILNWPKGQTISFGLPWYAMLWRLMFVAPMVTLFLLQLLIATIATFSVEEAKDQIRTFWRD
jgi:hypothetical protein